MKHLTNLTFFFLTAATCLVVFSYPVFPSQDGPIHLYYKEVYFSLLRDPNAYAGFFRIQHLLPPYALTIYLIALLEAVFPVAVAEKVLVCLCVIGFTAGFRYFATALGPLGPLFSLAALPFALHRLVYMGFYNYCFGVGLALFGCGAWLRWLKTANWKFALFYLALIGILLFTHPIPLLIVLCFCGGSLVLTLASGPFRWAPVVLFLVAASSLLYVAHFSGGGTRPVLFFDDLLIRLLFVLTFVRAAPVAKAIPVALLTLSALWLVVLLAKTRGRWTGMDFLLLAGVLGSLTMALIGPAQLGAGGYFIRERFPVFMLAFLVALAAARVTEVVPKWQAAFAAAMVLSTLGCLLVQRVVIGQMNDDIVYAANYGKGAAARRIALIADTNDTAPELSKDIQYSPLLWTPVRIALKNQSVLLNAPFSQLQYEPVTSREPAGYDPLVLAKLLASGARDTSDIDLLVVHDCGNGGAGLYSGPIVRKASLVRVGQSPTGCYTLFASPGRTSVQQ